MKLANCIYCRGDGPFNTEHVIQAAFGLFGTNTLTLTDSVCVQCNSSFGEGIDRIAARETLEAFERLKTGTKPVTEAHEVSHKNLHLQLQDGPLKGARFSAYPDNVVSSLGVQRKDTGDYEYFTLSELKRLNEFDAAVYITKPRLQSVLVLKEQSDRDIFEREIHRLGFKSTGASLLKPAISPGQKIQLRATVTIPFDAFRAYAKIQMNYLAKMTSSEFVLRQEFDSVRKFVRNGHLPNDEGWVGVRGRPLMSNTPEDNRRKAHLVSIKSLEMMDGEIVVGQLSLFSGLVYSFILGRFKAPVEMPTKLRKGIGHIFVPARREAFKMPDHLI